MPVSANFVVKEIGTLKNNLGRFVFCRKIKEEDSPLPSLPRDEWQKVAVRALGREIFVNVQANTSVRQLTANQLIANRPPLASILPYVDEKKGCGVALHSGMLPYEFFNLFQMAGERFQKDLKQYCSSVFLLPYIVDQNGDHVSGFEVSMAKTNLREKLKFMSLTDPAFSNDINTAIFLNTRDLMGKQYDGEEMLLHFCWLVGHTKLSIIMSNQGIRESQLGDPARDYFSSWYRRQVLLPVLSASSMQNSAFRENNQRAMDVIDNELATQVKSVSRAELTILASIMKG